MSRLFFILVYILAPFCSWAKTLNPAPYTVYLKQGAILTDLIKKNKISLEKGIYAKVLERDSNKRDFFLVYDNKGVAAYETDAKNIVEITEDTQLLPKGTADIVYPAPNNFQTNDEHAFFDTQFNLHYDDLLTSEFNTIYNDQLRSVLATRFEARTLYLSTLPANMGLTLNYQSTSWRNDVDQVKLTILSFGPVLQHFIYEEEKMAISLLAGAEYAPIYRTSSGDSVEKYQALLFDFGVESLWATETGKWSLGAHFRRHDLTLKESTRAGLQPLPNEITVNSIGMMIGYKYEWNL